MDWEQRNFKVPKLIVVFDIDDTLVHASATRALVHPEMQYICALLNEYRDDVHVFLYTNGLTHLSSTFAPLFNSIADVEWLNRRAPRHFGKLVRDIFAGGKRLTRPSPAGNPWAYQWGQNPVFDLRKSTRQLRYCLQRHYNCNRSESLPRIILFDDCGCRHEHEANSPSSGWDLKNDRNFKLYHTPFINYQFAPIISHLVQEIMVRHAW